MTVGIISHQQCLLHDMGEHHPESPRRLLAIQDQLISSGLEFAVRQFDAISLNPQYLSLVHEQAYIDFIFTNAPKNETYRLDEDTLMTPQTLPAALYAAGAAVQAVDLVMQKKLSAVFCATRPPGHHATKNKAMGFCIFNNIAIAAAYALKQYSLKKVAILDFDVHHGNGTENIFKNNPQVLLCSSFQHPFYPYSGTEPTSSNIINSPLPANASGVEFKKIVAEQWLHQLSLFKPDMLFISAGFDAHTEDDMSQVNLHEEDYRWVTKQLKQFADTHCEGRIVSLLEGGYSLNALGRSVVAHIDALIGN
ncbi:histone deacetylase family protein [Aliikangiella sp. IMCC44359]|uniref:histone deacetylase family protein n=1 Tax=Aliikangiella sp. IMCC44359 TaxID=3459125 RepID=UPI00403A8B85